MSRALAGSLPSLSVASRLRRHHVLLGRSWSIAGGPCQSFRPMLCPTGQRSRPVTGIPSDT